MPKKFDWGDMAEAMQGPKSLSVKKEEPKGVLADTMDMIMDSMKDQTGLFRGGAEGRVFGRVRDAVEGFSKGPTYSFMNEETLKDITSKPDDFYRWATTYVDPRDLPMVKKDILTYLGPDEGREFFKQNYDVHRMNREVLGRLREINPSREKRPEWVRQRPFVGPDTRIEDAGY